MQNMESNEKAVCASSTGNGEGSMSGIKFQTNEVTVQGGSFPHANFGNQEFHQNVFYDQRTVINRPSHEDPENLQRNTEEFLNRANRHFANQARHVTGIKSIPKLTLLDMDGSLPKSSTGGHGTEAIFGSDVEEIQIGNLHDAVNQSLIRHVMVLGEAGAGKSTLSRMYSYAVYCHKVESLDHIQLVVLVDAFDLLCDTPSKVFDLFFTHQMAGDPNTELTPEVQNAGLHWLHQNSNKMLVCIDGLDQSSTGIGGKRYPKVTSDTPAYTDTILANIMSGIIWRKAFILTTSRWSVYWALMAEQKPDKAVGLRGFDEVNMEKAARSLVPESCDAMLTYIRGTAPKLLALCQNPMFLSYTSKVFNANRNDLPDSISSLMAAVFLDFMHSRHLEDPDFESIAKLAFLGMMENRFEFSINYLKKHQIDPACLEGFLTIGALLRPGQREAKQHDKKYAFCHQSMQEFCAIIHVVSLEKPAIEDLVYTKLNDNAMMLMRKLLYGVLLNDKITRKIERYLEDHTCSIEECREILMRKLLEMISAGVIYDIRLITLIIECGDTIIEKIKHAVDRVHIQVVDLLKNDQPALLSFIKQCPSLKKVFIQQLWLDPLLIESVLSCCCHVDEFQAGYTIMDSVRPAHFGSVMTILDNTKVIRVILHCSDYLKNQFFSRWNERQQISFDSLGLLDVCCPEIIHKLYKFLSKFSLETLRLNLNFNTLTKESLKQISTASERIYAINSFMVEDKLLTAVKLDVYLAIFKVMMAKSLTLCRCDLTVDKLNTIVESCTRSDIKLSNLQLIDKSLSADGYRKLAAVLVATSCRSLGFQNCNLNKDHIVSMQHGFQEQNVQLNQLIIIDRFPGPQEYGKLPAMLAEVKCRNLTLIRCELSVEKLTAFESGCTSDNNPQCQIETLHISDKQLTEEGYSVLSSIVGKVKCRHLVLHGCDLYEEKLMKCTERCQSWNLQFLVLRDKLLNSGSFIGLANLISKAKCPNLSLSECDIDPETIDIFYQECKRLNKTIANLDFVNEGFFPSDSMMSVICCLIRDTITYLTLQGWHISHKHDKELSHALSVSKQARIISHSGIQLVKENDSNGTTSICRTVTS